MGNSREFLTLEGTARLAMAARGAVVHEDAHDVSLDDLVVRLEDVVGSV